MLGFLTPYQRLVVAFCAFQAKIDAHKEKRRREMEKEKEKEEKEKKESLDLGIDGVEVKESQHSQRSKKSIIMGVNSKGRALVEHTSPTAGQQAAVANHKKQIMSEDYANRVKELEGLLLDRDKTIQDLREENEQLKARLAEHKNIELPTPTSDVPLGDTSGDLIISVPTKPSSPSKKVSPSPREELNNKYLP